MDLSKQTVRIERVVKVLTRVVGDHPDAIPGRVIMRKVDNGLPVEAQFVSAPSLYNYLENALGLTRIKLGRQIAFAVDENMLSLLKTGKTVPVERPKPVRRRSTPRVLHEFEPVGDPIFSDRVSTN